MLIRWEAVDVLGTEVLLKQWKNEAKMLSCSHHAAVWRGDSATEVTVTIAPIQSAVTICDCIICFRGKDSKSIVV